MDGSSAATRASRREKANRARCGRPTLAGVPCAVKPPAGLDACRHHYALEHPESEVAAHVALERSRGGQMTARRGQADFAPADLTSVEGCHRVLQETVDAVRRGQVTPSVGQATATLVQTAIRLAEVALSKELRRLEKIVAERLPGGRLR